MAFFLYFLSAVDKSFAGRDFFVNYFSEFRKLSTEAFRDAREITAFLYENNTLLQIPAFP